MAPIVKQPIFDPTISVEATKNPNNTSCPICKFNYSRKDYYQLHMKKVHKNSINTPSVGMKCVSDPNIQPDPNDPNFYCRSLFE